MGPTFSQSFTEELAKTWTVFAGRPSPKFARFGIGPTPCSEWMCLGMPVTPSTVMMGWHPITWERTFRSNGCPSPTLQRKDERDGCEIHPHKGGEAVRDCAIFLCDLTGNMARPWADAGVTCFCVDTQHSIRRDRSEGNINFVWGDVRSWRPPEGHRIIFGAAFTPCTHVAGSGARDFAKKGGYMLRDAIEMFEAARQALAWSGAPYMLENSVGVMSSIPHIGKPDHYFDPNDFTLLEPADNYTKKTCIWSGNGFVMPPKQNDESLGPPDDRIHKATPGPGRENFRSATPMGFARAVFASNAPRHLRIKEEAA